MRSMPGLMRQVNSDGLLTSEAFRKQYAEKSLWIFGGDRITHVGVGGGEEEREC